MSDEDVQEYDDDLLDVLETVWGEGFLSPGGVDEVDAYLEGIDLGGKSVLDIGCGVGGVDLHLVKAHGARMVTGIDVECDLIPRCQRLAEKYDISNAVEFSCVEPGPLPFGDNAFDIVTSKDSIIHILDKVALAADIHRVLAPGGWFVASDWLCGFDAPSPEMQAYVEAEGLDFGLATVQVYIDAMQAAGFVDIDTTDRNSWYRETARSERDQLAGEHFEQLSAAVGEEFLRHQIDVWDKMIVALDQGQLRPTHLRGRKPDA
ncbi:MAG: methyltransferase domain-containing protein [Pseudomonadota bacterium]